GNLVRMPDGRWNYLAMLHTLQQGRSPKAPEEDSADDAAGPSPLPLRDLSVNVRRIDLRVVDSTRELEAGWEDGSLELLWPGGAVALTTDIVGTVRVNE